MQLGAKLKSFWFAPVDARRYALIRVAYSFAGLINLYTLWPVRHQFFSSSGIIAQNLNHNFEWSELPFSVFGFWDSEGAITVIFVIAALSLLALGLGLFTRISALLCWVWACSFRNGIFPAFAGHDDIFVLWGFLILISPVGRVWSLDSLFGGKKEDSNPQVPCYGLRLMQWQLALIYWTSGVLKLGSVDWTSGNFLPYFLMSLYSRYPDPIFAHFSTWFMGLNYLVLIIELTLPMLLWYRKTRALGFILGYGLHASIGIASILPEFSIAMMMTYLAFVDGMDFIKLRTFFNRVRGK